jgi:hypothetical protein
VAPIPSEERLAPEALLSAMPPGLRGALSAMGADVQSGWREGERHYVRAIGSRGPVLVRFGPGAAYADVLAHEVHVRGLVGADGPLRSPPVLAHARGWLVEARVDPWPLEGPDATQAAIAAAAAIPGLELPPSPRAAASRSPLRARVRRLRASVPALDLLRARRVLASSPLPRETSHGDFHPGNVLFTGTEAWVVDWELSGLRPRGWDLLHLWVGLAREADRALVLERALAGESPSHRKALLRLRYAALVRVLLAKLAPDRPFDRDDAGARRLLALLPAVRREADLSRI